MNSDSGKLDNDGKLWLFHKTSYVIGVESTRGMVAKTGNEQTGGVFLL